MPQFLGLRDAGLRVKLTLSPMRIRVASSSNMNICQGCFCAASLVSSNCFLWVHCAWVNKRDNRDPDVEIPMLAGQCGSCSNGAQFFSKKMHHLGIEPRTSAWKADILPLN